MTYLPDRPLERFAAIYDALMAHKTWTIDAMTLRHTALTLTTTSGQPAVLAAQAMRKAELLKAQAGWFGALNSSIRFIVAAQLLSADQPVEGFDRRTEAGHELFRDYGLRRGATYEVLAIHVLGQAAGGRSISPETVQRFRDVYEMMKSYHWWLTGPDDYPACAILTQREASIQAMGQRIEAIYTGLRARLAAGDPLQLASHLLYQVPGSATAAVQRFFGLFDEFRRRDVQMWQDDYDELALLAFLDHPPVEIVDRVIEHRGTMKQLRPNPGVSATFSLAANTAFLELVKYGRDMQELVGVTQLVNAQQAIQAQQAAACAAACAAASSAAAASASSN